MKIVVLDMNSTMIPQVGVMLDEALLAKDQGHSIVYVTCGGYLRACYSNPLKSKLFCRICTNDYRDYLQKYLGDNIQHKTLEDYSDSGVETAVKDFDVYFETMEELRKKSYKGVDVGYAALSSFISNTRNLNPVLTDFSKEVLAKQLLTAVQMTLISEQVHKVEKPDKVIIFNGRMPEARPILRYFHSVGIDVDVNEVYSTNLTGDFKKVVFKNSLPHSIQYFQKRMHEEWDKNKSQAVEIGKKFYHNRRNAAFSGDKIYIKDQETGLLPKGWNSSSRNIVIFNSSEDEFAAIGKEWEERLFTTQLEGIKYIFDCVQKYPDAEVYLRVHPNLKKIHYKYHTDLYKLETHERIHVIPAASKISTYALVDAASIVVSFGTSVGIEAAYAAKPVVLLGSSLYKGLGLCYEPKNVIEMERLIFQDILAPLSNENILKYGNYILSDKGKDYTYYNFNCRQIKIGPFSTPNVTMIDQVKSLGVFKSFTMRFWRYLQRQFLRLRIPEA